MKEFLIENLLVIGRVFTILPLLLFVALFMGKRAIGELPVFDLLIVVTLGSVVGADIADPNIHHIPTAIAILAIGVLQKLIARWKISNRKIGQLLTFESTVIIQNGKLIHPHIKKMSYSIDNVLQMLREKNVFDISEVETAIIEANGAMSVLKKPQKNTVTLEDLNITKTASTITFPVIVEGTVYENVLKDLNLDKEWLHQQLANQGVTDPNKVFYATVNRSLELHTSLKNEPNLKIPTIRH